MSSAVVCGLIMLTLVVVLLVIGTPISVAIGTASAAAMLTILAPEKAILVSAQKMFSTSS